MADEARDGLLCTNHHSPLTTKRKATRRGKRVAQGGTGRGGGGGSGGGGSAARPFRLAAPRRRGSRGGGKPPTTPGIANGWGETVRTAGGDGSRRTAVPGLHFPSVDQVDPSKCKPRAIRQARFH